MALRSTNPATLWSSDGIHRQGSLDGLCGVYCAINGISLLTQGDVDCRALFARVICNLRRKLPTVILDGLKQSELEKNVLGACQTYLADEHNLVLNFDTVEAEALADYWTQMREHHALHGEGSILLSISGSYEHWTCVKKITQKCITLADSSQLKRLYRSRVTVGEPTKQRIHMLLPEETYLLSIGSM